MQIRCRVFRGLAREAEEDVNKYLASHAVRVLHLAQSESGDHITITLIVELLEPARGER
jgi:hypothetical protein